MRLHYNAREGENIQYVELMSLYPYKSKYFKIPVDQKSHPCGSRVQKRGTLQRKDGFIKCSIVPKERLYNPVLPFRANQKLMFCLNRTCVLTFNTGECCHTTDKERALTGTWVIDEFRLSMQKGLKVL